VRVGEAREIVRRAPIERGFAVCAGALGIFQAGVMIGTGMPVAGVLVGITIVGMAIRAFRVSVVLGSDGLTIRNFVRTYKLSWTEVEEIAVRPRGDYPPSIWRVLWDLVSFKHFAKVRPYGRRPISLNVTLTPYQSRDEALSRAELIRRRRRESVDRT
jgi:hypothetical protein